MARGGVYRVRVGKSPLGPTEQDRDPLWNRKVSMESHRARKFPHGAARCPGSTRSFPVEQRGAHGCPKTKAGSPLPEPPTHSCGSSGSGSSCTCRTLRRSRSHLESEGRRAGSAGSREAGSQAGGSRDRTGHLPAAHVQSWGSMARLGSV